MFVTKKKYKIMKKMYEELADEYDKVMYDTYQYRIFAKTIKAQNFESCIDARNYFWRTMVGEKIDNILESRVRR